MRTTQHTALAKASRYKEQPTIPPVLAHFFPEHTHFHIRAYHRRIVHRDNGIRKKSRFVTGYIFIFTVTATGAISPHPLRVVHIRKATRRDFASLGRLYSQNTNDILMSLFN